MNTEVQKRVIKEIKVDVEKCIGCRACEMACSAFHARPRFSSVNPARSRIRVVFDELKDIYVPTRAGDYTKAECTGRHVYSIGGKEYPECSFCGVSCPARDYFKEPDSGLPLKCDMCEEDPTLDEPWCVKVCQCDALTYHVWEEEAPCDEPRDELEVGLESLSDRFGLQKVLDTMARLSAKNSPECR